MDWTLFVAWAGIGIALGALLVSGLAFRQNARHYPKPELVDESTYAPGGLYPWRVSVRNVGNADATEVQASALILRSGAVAPVAEDGFLKPGGEFVQSFSLDEIEPTEVWLTLSWREGPNFGKVRTRKLKVPKHKLSRSVRRLFLRLGRGGRINETLTQNRDIGLY